MRGARLEQEISPRWEEESAGLHRLMNGIEETKLRRDAYFPIILTDRSTPVAHRLRSKTSPSQCLYVQSGPSRGVETIIHLKMLLPNIVRRMLSTIHPSHMGISHSMLLVQSTTSAMESGNWTRTTLKDVDVIVITMNMPDLSSPHARTPALEVRLRLFISTLYNNLSILSQLPGCIRSGLVTIISLI